MEWSASVEGGWRIASANLIAHSSKEAHSVTAVPAALRDNLLRKLNDFTDGHSEDVNNTHIPTYRRSEANFATGCGF